MYTYKNIHTSYQAKIGPDTSALIFLDIVRRSVSMEKDLIQTSAS